MKFADLLVQELKQFECEALFGIPGDFILPLLCELQDNGALPFYTLNHEPSVIYAADAAARIRQRPQAALLTYGAGALNAVNAIAQAYVERVPLVILAGFPAQQEIDRNVAIHHQAKDLDSQRRILSEVTELQVRLNDPATASGQLRAALQCCRETSRPVLIEIPRDAISFNCVPLPPYHPPQMPEREAVKLASYLLQRLQNARHPVFLVGIEVQRFGAAQAVEDLALQLNIPIVTSFLARASISHDHPCYHGTFIDESDTHAYQLLQESDLIIHLGVIVTDSNFAAYPSFVRGDAVVQLHQGTTYLPHERCFDTDLQALCLRLLSYHLPPYSTWFEPTPASEFDPHLAWNSTTVVELIDAQLSSQDACVPIISDVGDCLFASLHADASHVIAPAYYASMGYSIPAALGVHVTTGLRSVVLVGDGAFLMTGLELCQAIHFGASPIVILFNNRRWDMIEAFAPELTCTNLPECDFQRLNQALGAVTHQANDSKSFAAAFNAAWTDSSKLQVIEVQLGRERSARLTRFADAFTQRLDKGMMQRGSFDVGDHRLTDSER